MKLKYLVTGFVVGSVAGTVSSVITNKKQQKLGLYQAEDKQAVQSLKASTEDLKENVNVTKDNAQVIIKEVIDEMKNLVASFKSDIEPNIEHLKLNVDNLSNRGKEIQETFQK